MSKVLQVFLKRALSGGEGPQTPPLTAMLFWFQYSGISKIFWIETLCSVLVYIPKVVHGRKILRKRFSQGRSCTEASSGPGSWCGEATPTHQHWPTMFFKLIVTLTELQGKSVERKCLFMSSHVGVCQTVRLNQQSNSWRFNCKKRCHSQTFTEKSNKCRVRLWFRWWITVQDLSSFPETWSFRPR